ncbi:hypothetical protein KFE25_013954 [Diacronema lutheri]|uniref:Zinc-ribbon 15 domain-containing protein n=1 Tax=Diacronema lutheri TaxID=2081491 RepID=A0A8J5XMR7_DIALT|nr:hypothetical protein KFE25_013954 [Diacronema lutheri]
MFWFFLGGVEPVVTRVLERRVGRCPLPHCPGDLDRAELASVLSLFAVPVYAFNRREALRCATCGFVATVEQREHVLARSRERPSRECASCGAELSSDKWRFCPHCGAPRQWPHDTPGAPAASEPPARSPRLAAGGHGAHGFEGAAHAPADCQRG